MNHESTSLPFDFELGQDMTGFGEEPSPVAVLEHNSELGAYGLKRILPDQELTGDQLEQLGDRWLVIVHDLKPAQGPGSFGMIHKCLLHRATSAILDWGQCEAENYYDAGKGAMMGARIVVIRTEERWRADWIRTLGASVRGLRVFEPSPSLEVTAELGLSA